MGILDSIRHKRAQKTHEARHEADLERGYSDIHGAAAGHLVPVWVRLRSEIEGEPDQYQAMIYFADGDGSTSQIWRGTKKHSTTYGAEGSAYSHIRDMYKTMLAAIPEGKSMDEMDAETAQYMADLKARR